MNETKSDTVSPKKSTKPVNAILMLKAQRRDEIHNWIKLCESDYMLGQAQGALETIKAIVCFELFGLFLLIVLLALRCLKIEIPLLPVWVFLISLLAGEGAFKWRNYRLKKRHKKHKENLELLENSLLETYKEEK